MMKRLSAASTMIFAGVLGITAVAQSNQAAKSRKKSEIKESLIRRFLRAKNCPDQDYAGQFVTEADANGLDWRLLPSLAFVESGGGKTARGNNLFGWENGKTRFDSVSEAIHHVAGVLAHGRAYAGKSLDAKLATYNRRPDYRDMVRKVMNQISPIPQVEATAD